MYPGNQSKYSRTQNTTPVAQHLAYIPKLGDNFQDVYRKAYDTPASVDIITHCKHELFQLIWLLILDDEFMDAYVNGFEHTFPDGVQ
ncbi:hypothetical protein APHAL10511_006600 [Amanita phalloides]|nr:hypothetical protein APHAL10511_006600 [Amanita phalloides]